MGDGGLAEGGGDVGGTAGFVGEFDNAEETVAEAAVVALDDFREGLGVAALQRPEAEPAETEVGGGPERGERGERAQPDGGVPEAVGEEEEGEREQQAAERAAEGDGGVHAPEALLHGGELEPQGFGELAERCGVGWCHNKLGEGLLAERIVAAGRGGQTRLSDLSGNGMD